MVTYFLYLYPFYTLFIVKEQINYKFLFLIIFKIMLENFVDIYNLPKSIYDIFLKNPSFFRIN